MSKLQQLWLPPPYGGWNTEQSDATADPRFAFRLENWTLRPGQMLAGVATEQPWAGTLPGRCMALLEFPKATGNELWAFVLPITTFQRFDIRDLTGAPAIGPVITTLETIQEGREPGWTVISTGGTTQLLVFAGPTVTAGGAALSYNGTAWTPIVAFGSLDADNIRQVTNYKQRLFFVEHNTLNLWFLPPNSVAGAATQYPLGAIFQRGGALVDVATWTVDTGSGPDDMLVVMSDQGEIAVFTGTDPTSPFTWSLVGVFYSGLPAAYLPLRKVGGDVWVFTTRGVLSVAALLKSTILSRQQELSQAIRRFFVEGSADAGAVLYNNQFAHSGYNPESGVFVASFGGSNTSRLPAVYWIDARAWSAGLAGATNSHITALGNWRGRLIYAESTNQPTGSQTTAFRRLENRMVGFGFTANALIQAIPAPGMGIRKVEQIRPSLSWTGSGEMLANVGVLNYSAGTTGSAVMPYSGENARQYGQWITVVDDFSSRKFLQAAFQSRFTGLGTVDNPEYLGSEIQFMQSRV